MNVAAKTMIYMGEIYSWDRESKNVVISRNGHNTVIGICSCVSQVESVIRNYHMKLEK